MSSSGSSGEEREETDCDSDEGKSSSDDTSGKVEIPERKSKSVCDDKSSQLEPNNAKSRPTGPSLPFIGGRGRKPSLGHATSLPLPQRSNSTGVETVVKQKSLQRCPTMHHTIMTPAKPQDKEMDQKASVPPTGTPKRKESVSWSPFGALGKAVSSGVNIVGDATKAVGTGVVQGTKAVGTGVVTGTKAVGTGVVSAAETVGSGVVTAAETVGDGVVKGTKVVGTGVAAVGTGVVNATEAVGSAAASGVAVVGTATVTATKKTTDTINATVDDSTHWVKEKRRSVIMHTRKTTVHVADENDTLGIIAAKYKTTCEDIIALNKQLADRKVQPGDEIKVPTGEKRKSSRNRDSVSFISGLSMSLFEDDDMAEGMDVAESRCLILSSAPSGPKTVIQGYMILDCTNLTISWGREDPLTFTEEDFVNLALIYGSNEHPEFTSLVERSDHSAGHSFSETDVFPVCDEEPELEGDSSYGTDDHSPRHLNTQDSDDLSTCGSYKTNSFDERLDAVPSDINGTSNAEIEETKGHVKSETDNLKTHENTNHVKNGNIEDENQNKTYHEKVEQESRKIPQGRRCSRKRTFSKERRTSLLFEDTMATYFYIELAETSTVATKSPAAMTLSSSLSPSDCITASPDTHHTNKLQKSWSFSNTTPAFIIRVPNESVIRLFSLLIRNYGTKYGVGPIPMETPGFTKLTMDTLTNASGEAKVGKKLNKSSVADMDDEETNDRNMAHLDISSDILDEDDIELLRERLPTRLENNEWTLAFSTTRDGFSLSTLYRKTQDLDCPVLLTIQDVDQAIFGGLLSEPPKVTEAFRGTGECWLFSLAGSGDLSVYKWTTANTLFIKGCTKNLVVGAGDGQFGLWFDGDLDHGRTQPCETFGNPPLTTSSDFNVKCIECWAFLPST